MKFNKYLNLYKQDQIFVLERWNKNSSISSLLCDVIYTLLSPDSFFVFKKIISSLRNEQFQIKKFEITNHINFQVNEFLYQKLEKNELFYIKFTGLIECKFNINGHINSLGENSFPIFVIHKKNISKWTQLVLNTKNSSLIISSLDFSITLELENGEDEYGKYQYSVYTNV